MGTVKLGWRRFRLLRYYCIIAVNTAVAVHTLFQETAFVHYKEFSICRSSTDTVSSKKRKTDTVDSTRQLVTTKDQRYVDIFALFIIFRNESYKIKSVLLDAQ